VAKKYFYQGTLRTLGNTRFCMLNIKKLVIGVWLDRKLLVNIRHFLFLRWTSLVFEDKTINVVPPLLLGTMISSKLLKSYFFALMLLNKNFQEFLVSLNSFGERLKNVYFSSNRNFPIKNVPHIF